MAGRAPQASSRKRPRRPNATCVPRTENRREGRSRRRRRGSSERAHPEGA
jgi:hypothetical protein